MAAQTSQPPQAATRRWSSSNSRQVMKAYDHSPIISPPTTPPTLSRNNSSASINSTKSEPAWTSRRHVSEPDLRSGDLSDLRQRKQSTTSQASAQTTASHKKSGLKGLFARQKDPQKEKAKELEKMKRKKEHEQLVITSRHAAAVKARMITDPAYRDFQQRHKKPDVKTAKVDGEKKSSHSAAAEQEARHPHSGPPAVHGGLDIPLLTRIESHDEPDDELDRFEKFRREWNEAKEHNMNDIPEVRSRFNSPRASPWASPVASREPSPNRFVARPGIGSKRNSYAGGYTKDSTGRWTRKTPPSVTPPMSRDNALNTDLLAASLAERLNAAA